MKVAVLGAGAVGCLLGGLMSDGHEVSLIGRRPAVSSVNSKGLIIEGLKELVAHPRAYTDPSKPGVQDLVIICVKSYDADQAFLDARPLIAPWTKVLIVQNGLDVLKGARRINGALVHIGVASLGVTLVGPGHVRYAGNGSMAIGSLNGRLALATLLAEDMREMGLDAVATDDIMTAVWRKAVINSAINPITAIVRSTNDCISLDDGLRRLSEDVFRESMEVAVRRGALVPGSMDFDDVMKVVRATASNRSSMLQDLERGKRTEIDAINGAIGSIDPTRAVLNRSLAALVRAQEARI